MERIAVFSVRSDSTRLGSPGACPLALRRWSHTVAITHPKYPIPLVSLPSVPKYSSSALSNKGHRSSSSTIKFSCDRRCQHQGERVVQYSEKEVGGVAG
eukprot:1763351-Ditylum_brightwellii.AAC.1